MRRTIFKTAVAVIILSCLGVVVWSTRNEIGLALGRADWRMATAALGVCLVYRLLNAAVWSVVLGALGQRAGAVTSAKIWLQTEALRWVPGGVWGYCSRVVEATRHGIPRGAAALSLPLELGVTIAAWTVAAVAGLGFSGMAAHYAAMLPELPTWFFGVVVAGSSIVIYVLTLPKVRWGLWRRTRPRLEALGALLGARPSIGKTWAAFCSYSGLCFLQGIGFYFALHALWPEAEVSPLAAIGVNAAAWLAGFFAIGAPGGLGVREAGLCSLLLPLLPLEQAALVAVFWRALQIAVEVLSLGVVWIAAPPHCEPVMPACHENSL